MIVDDDDRAQEVARRALAASGLSVEVAGAATCAEALRALTDRAFDCVLLDFQLPDGDGLDVLRHIRSARIDVPVVMLTDHGDEMVAVELMKAGAADYLAKSRLTPEALERCLRHTVRVHRAEQQTRQAKVARQDSEAQFRRVVESNLIGFLFWETTGQVIDANDAFLQMVGFSRADLAAGGVNWKTLTPPEYAEQDEQVLAELARSGTFPPFEKEFFRKDGGRVAVLVSASFLDGPGSRGLAFVVDVTEQKRGADAQRFLAEAGDVLASSLDYPATLAGVAALAVPRLADWCAVDLQDRDGAMRRVVSAYVDPAQGKITDDRIRRLPGDASAAAGPRRVSETGQAEMVVGVSRPLLTLIAHEDAPVIALCQENTPSYLCVPMVARGRTLGAITLVSCPPSRPYDDTDLRLAAELARRTALAVDNTRLFLETRARADREAVVNAIGRALRGSLDADEILNVATEEVGHLLQVSRCGWYWLAQSQDALQVAPQQYAAPGVARFSGSFPLTTWDPKVLSRWAAGDVVSVADTDADAQTASYREVLLRPNSIRAFISCPVFLRGTWAGLFVVHQTDGVRAWTPDEVALLRQVADMLAPTLENARLYAREHRVADMLQAAFMTNVPDRMATLDLATVYHAGLDESQVGGDFYDAFTLSDGRVGLVMGDVSGKGLSAAVLTATVKFSLRAFAAEVASPGLVLTRLNRTLRHESAGLGEHFVTLFYGVYDPNAGRLTYASAGHETQLIKRQGGGTVPLHSSGPILGIAEHRFDQRTELLHIGDALVLYTDGLTEARSVQSRELLDLTRVAQLLASVGPEVGAGGLAAHLERSAMDWTGGRPQDDLALLVARRSPASQGQEVATLDMSRPFQEAARPEGDLLFEFVFPSRADYAAEVRQAVAHWMDTLGFDRNAVEDFQTAVTEAVTNAVRHGSPSGPSDQFAVTGRRPREGAFTVEVTDSGPGFPFAATPLMPDPDATNGRGLPFMQTFADAVEFLPSEAGLRVRLTKTLAAP